MRRPRRSVVLVRGLLAAWAVMLPILAAPAATDGSIDSVAIVATAADDGCPCRSCPNADPHPVCPRETPPPCRSQDSCARCVVSPGTALFLAPAPTLISPPSPSGPVGWIDLHATDMAFTPPKPPPRAAILS